MSDGKKKIMTAGSLLEGNTPTPYEEKPLTAGDLLKKKESEDSELEDSLSKSIESAETIETPSQTVFAGDLKANKLRPPPKEEVEPAPVFAPGKESEEYITYKSPAEPEKYVPLSTNHQIYKAASEGDYETSNKVIADVLAKSPEDPYAHRIAYYNAKKAGEATTVQLDKALSLNPTDIPLLADKAKFGIEVGNGELATDMANQVLANIPPDTQDLSLLGYKAYALTVLSGVIQSENPGGARDIIAEKLKVEDQMEEIRESQEPPTSMEYIMSKGINNSLIGMALRGGLPEGSIDPQYDRFRDYEPTFGEQVSAGVVSVFTDLPFFAVGGAGGAAIGKTGINLTTKLLLNQARKEILKKGLTKEATDLQM